MAFKRQPAEKCGGCSRIDRESYRGAGLIVCYYLDEKDGKRVAREVKESRPACREYRAEQGFLT